MKKMILLLMTLMTVITSCQEDWTTKAPIEQRPLTYDEEFAIVNNYTNIDSVNNCYSVTITDEIMQNEHLTFKNVKLILQEISRINLKIQEDIKDGTVTTLTLNNCHGFQSYTANANKSQIKFTDAPATQAGTATTRGGHVGGLSFTNGNWNNYSATFYASDHVTSNFYVNASGRYYWYATIVCNTGTTAYGNKFSASGTGSYSATRFWWWEGGGSAPFQWNFEAKAPIGGDATGSFSISDTY